MATEGKFEVTLEPQQDVAAPAGRMSMRKVYSGGLVGTALGQMISKRTEAGESVYSAVEEFDGALDGKTGGFSLFHVGRMSSAGQSLEVTVVAGSGRGDLEGIGGHMTIIQEGGEHRYVFDYIV
ncbi:DUF3224 domain-containing protein [Halioglobus maricola]|uniref:DUF3224 domain-containing protein n=1 Tax=Halioglobus maricola TaxID=2601894 RepID=A0A5P9NMP9_9GAMM|nr:DUF3224 domain-containing protein [Halioglobus maricola]QFU77057.1 DUF3224 domain-containing protein [Halioglobus maricola]